MASIFPSTSISIPTPFQPIHPHTIRLFPPPCLTVGVVVRSEMDSPFCFHTYNFPSDPILFIFVSSDHKTLFQSSTVQFSCLFAKPLLTMSLLQHRHFLLCSRAKP